MKQQGSLTIGDAYKIIQQRGVEGAVAGYCTEKEFKDVKLKTLWKNAREAINQLDDYVSTQKNDINPIIQTKSQYMCKIHGQKVTLVRGIGPCQVCGKMVSTVNI